MVEEREMFSRSDKIKTTTEASMHIQGKQSQHLFMSRYQFSYIFLFPKLMDLRYGELVWIMSNKPECINYKFLLVCSITDINAKPHRYMYMYISSLCSIFFHFPREHPFMGSGRCSFRCFVHVIFFVISAYGHFALFNDCTANHPFTSLSFSRNANKKQDNQ